MPAPAFSVFLPLPRGPISQTPQSSHIARAHASPYLPQSRPSRHDLATRRDPSRIRIFDTTLRDGEQSPGAALNPDEKLIIARQLHALNVDVLEAGFPVSSTGDFEAVKQIAMQVGNALDPPIISGMSRAVESDIRVCFDAIKYAAFPRIHTSISTSPLHMRHKLRKTPEQVLRITEDMVAYAASLCDDVEFGAEDSSRSDPHFLAEVFSTAIRAGATTINIPDTVGYSTPGEFGELVSFLANNIVGVENAVLSVHCHNDLGLAVANSLAGIQNGARQLEVTVNGIGERAGNASLEELVMALHVRREYYNSLLARDRQRNVTNIELSEIYKSSKTVSILTGMPIQPNKPIVGCNAFSHASGIHQDGVLKNRHTYEIIDASLLGLKHANIVLGKFSGRHALQDKLKQLGHSLHDEQLQDVYVKFKKIADEKKLLSDADIIALVVDQKTEEEEEKQEKQETAQLPEKQFEEMLRSINYYYSE